MGKVRSRLKRIPIFFIQSHLGESYPAHNPCYQIYRKVRYKTNRTITILLTLPLLHIYLILTGMQTEVSTGIIVETIELPSEALQRTITINFYGPASNPADNQLSLLLLNDGQDIEAMGFDKMIAYLLQTETITPLLCVGIHCGEDRLQEYGMISSPDFKGR